MTAESRVILGIGVALVLFILVRCVERHNHERKLKALQDKIARRQSGRGNDG